MARIVSNQTEKLDLGNGEWVEYRTQVSFAELDPIIISFDSANSMANIKMAIPLLEIALVGWNLLDDSNEPIPFDKDKIKQLDTNTIIEVFPKIIQKYFPEKKSSTTSVE